MITNQRGRRLLLLVAVGTVLVVAGSGVAAACETCVDPNQEETEYEPVWSSDDFPYDTDENNSFVGIVVEEIEREMEADFGGENASAEPSGNASAANASASATVNAGGASADATAEGGGLAAAVDLEVSIGGW